MTQRSWYEDYLNDGYAVIPSLLSRDKAEGYQQAAFTWLKSFDNPNLDLSDPSTWTSSNLPFISEINTFNHYAVVHEKFMWDIRLEPSVIEAFSQIWGTDDLLVSFDALNITLPRRPGHVPRERWPHVDSSPYRRGLECVQGIVNLSESGPEDGGLVVFPGTHKVTEEFFQDHTDQSAWTKKDFYRYTKEELSWFTDRGFDSLKVVAKPGDVIIWDSRLIHYGSEPSKNSSVIRTAIYVSYSPASFASEEALEAKREAFRQWLATTHWPHDNIVLRSNHPVLSDGTIDDRRTAPLEEPERTGRLLRLAGLERY